MKKRKSSATIVNRQIKRDYQLLDTYLAGIVLFGHEAKSLRTGSGDLRGSYVTFSGGELWLTNSYIAPYSFASLSEDYDPNRRRKLLLTKKEMIKLADAKQNKLTIVPTKLLIKRKYVKLEIATARGLKKYDKRHKIKARIDSRESKRTGKASKSTKLGKNNS